VKCTVCGAENPDKNQFCSSCGKPLPGPQVPAGPVREKKQSRTTWIVIGAVILLITIVALFFILKSPAASKAPVVGKWAVGDNWVQLNDDYSTEAYHEDSGLTVQGTWEELDATRYQVDWDTGGQDILVYDSVSQSLAPEGSTVRMTKAGAIPENTGSSSGQAQVQTTCDPAAEELYLITESNAAVQNNPANPRIITISSPVYVTRIMTYHYNSNKGAVPGTIGLKDEDGKMYGPWQSVDDKGNTGTASVHWSVKINQLVPAGKYTLVDSDPSTWSTNSEVGNAGVVWVYVSKKCSTTSSQNTPAPSGPAPFVQVPSGTPVRVAAGQVVHGTITTGAPVVAAQGSVSISGGMITVNQPGSAIDGLKFVAPAGAYPSGQQVTISSAPVTGNTFGSYFNPATPMIEINAGQAYADEPVFVTIPVNIPDDQFAMAFYYDDVGKKLEGVPTSGQDSKSITIATRHFSNIIVSLINKDILDRIKTVDSGFRPGVDDWEFVNAGSYVANGGHCSGQSATMMWYYTEQRQKANASPLFNRYDNNGREPARQFGVDDTLGYRFASIIQEKSNFLQFWKNVGAFVTQVSSDSNTFRAFKYSILMTGEPQNVFVYPGEGNLGHAIVCYKVSDATMWIADPNYPGKERTITLVGDSLTPYSWGENSQDSKENTLKNGQMYFPVIKYFAKSAEFSWPLIAEEYAKVHDGTIGDDMFPPYKVYIRVTNDDGTKKEFVIDAGKNQIVNQIDVEGKTVSIVQQLRSASPDTDKMNASATVYDQNGVIVQKKPITLAEGSNTFVVIGHGNPGGWLGFDWIDLNYKPKTVVATTAITAPAGQHYTATIYAVLDSASYDADCGFADKAYDTSGKDPYCETIPSYSPIAVMCGKPPGKCIDSKWNNGVHGVFTYYNTLGTKVDGSTYITNRLKDGDMFYYTTDGTIVSQVSYKDGTWIKTVK
jgi:predicted nucleic acid-binding Zn ribbon protein